MVKALHSFLILLVLPALISAQSIELWGVSAEGGEFNGGTLFSLNSDGNNFTKHYDFKDDAGFNPAYTHLILGGDGYLYGITSEGGKYSDGVLFRINTGDHHFEKAYELQNFPDSVYLNNHQDGKSATGSLVKSSFGVMYGMASKGGSENQGTIFGFDPLLRTFDKIYDFNDTVNPGKNPSGSLVESVSYWFYGMTTEGGINNNGVVFRFNGLTHVFSVVHQLSDDDGTNPIGDFLESSDGKLYGMASYGGAYNQGTIFRVNPFTLSFNKLLDFGPGIGSHPRGALIFGDNNLLYGITTNGGSSFGTIFACDPDSESLQSVYSFDNINGSHPVSGMVKTSNGKFYGMTPEGGTNDKGVIYSFDPLTNQLTKLLDFDGSNGANPQGSLIEAPDGWLYGMTTEGGSDNMGTIFKFNPLTLEFTQLYQFRIAHHGSLPEALIEYTDGSIYGTTQEGGDYHAGIVYRFYQDIDSLEELFEFREDLDQAYLPRENLIIGNDQKIYGMTLWHYDGGGSIWNYDPSTLDYDTVANAGYTLGENPQSGLLPLPDGTMIGTMSRGGSADYGVIFKFNPASLNYEVIYDWQDAINGNHPRGRLALHSDGMIYGTTEAGGTNNKGTIFRFNQTTSALTPLFNFNPATDGENPKGLIEGRDGRLYGMTHDGGSMNGGTLFRFSPSTLAFEKLVDFDSASTGGIPDGALLLASDSNFYGCNSLGGLYGAGTVFQYNHVTGYFSVIHHFETSEGRLPHGELMEYKIITGIPDAEKGNSFQVYPNPSSEYFVLSGLKDFKTKNYSVSLNDITGRKILSAIINEMPFVLDAGKTRPGVFMMQLTDGSNKIIATQKVVIQR